MNAKHFLLSFSIAVIALSSAMATEELKKHSLMMSLEDQFVVAETDAWSVEVQRYLPLRFADVLIHPKKDKSFSMKLFFKCDTKDLAAYDTPEKMKKSIYVSSQDYLPYAVEDKVTVEKLPVKKGYGYYTVITDAQWANAEKIPEGEFKYMVRGLVRLSPDSALGFSIMTNDLESKVYKSLEEYIKSFIKFNSED